MSDATAHRILDKAAADLAAMREPDLREFTGEEVDDAMLQAFTATGPKDEWLAALRRRIDQLSNSLTHLRDADPETFPYRVKSMSAAYQSLQGPSGNTILLIIGPFQPPFQFIPNTTADR